MACTPPSPDGQRSFRTDASARSNLYVYTYIYWPICTGGICTKLRALSSLFAHFKIVVYIIMLIAPPPPPLLACN